MPKQQRRRTKYTGVYYVLGTGVDGRSERIYYIYNRNGGTLMEEFAGNQSETI